ncbi:hypothetical protein VTK56DRAFT_8254 [Thermocarpiscus australiensis]
MSSTVPLPDILEFPLSVPDECEFKFVGEGGLNVVFEVLMRHDGRNGEKGREVFQGTLLRVPKAGTKAHGYVELQEYWETVVMPLFEPEDLVQYRLVKLGGAAVVSRMNAVLVQEDNTRRADFRGSRVAVTEYGMLMEDMRQKRPGDLVIEFKPKWLAQSPGAPPSATRCRTCAREAQKHHSKASIPPRSQKPKKRTILCPLDLLICGISRLALTNILNHFTSPDLPQTPQQHTRLIHWLQTNTLLPRLRTAQLAHDGGGPLQADAHDARFQLAMTLRDCTCFVRIPADPAAPVEAKLADLDKKNWAVKLDYWRAVEARLIEGGYYEGKEQPRQGTDCQLERVKAEGLDRGTGGLIGKQGIQNLGDS